MFKLKKEKKKNVSGKQMKRRKSHEAGSKWNENHQPGLIINWTCKESCKSNVRNEQRASCIRSSDPWMRYAGNMCSLCSSKRRQWTSASNSNHSHTTNLSIELLYLHLKWFKIRNGLCFVFYAEPTMATGHPCNARLCLCDREMFNLKKKTHTSTSFESTCTQIVCSPLLCICNVCAQWTNANGMELNHFTTMPYSHAFISISANAISAEHTE